VDLQAKKISLKCFELAISNKLSTFQCIYTGHGLRALDEKFLNLQYDLCLDFSYLKNEYSKIWLSFQNQYNEI